MRNPREIAAGVARQLQEHGFIAVFAGGCVRDRFLGKTPKDYDVATNASPDQIKRVFTGDTVLLVGEAFGVIIVVRESEQIEVATLRGDGQYGDGRRPDSVRFLTGMDPIDALREDAARRDLTINAMFEDPVTGEVYDFFGGRQDLENRIIRAVGDAGQRFAEDRLRMLRVVRFAAKLGFSLDPSLFEALKRYAPELRPGEIVAYERIAKEIAEILISKNPVLGLNMLVETGLAKEFLWEVLEMLTEEAMGDPIWHPEGLTWVHTMMVLEILVQDDERSFELMFAALLHDVAKARTRTTRVEEHGGNTITRVSNHGHAEKGAEMARVICNRFKLSGDQTKRVTEIVRLHMQMHDFADPKIRPGKLVRLLQREDIMDLIRMQHADAMGTGRTEGERKASSHRDFYLARLAKLKSNPVTELVKGDLIARLGFKPGQIFRLIKEEAFEAQVRGEFDSPETAEEWLRERAEGYRQMTAAEVALALSSDDADASPRVPARGKHCC